jgi:hypothetical protein
MTPSGLTPEELQEKIERMDREALRKYGWFARFVPSGADTPFGISYHTYGLPRLVGQPDLQVCLNVSRLVLHGLITVVIGKMKAGEVIQPGRIYYNVDENLPVQFIEAREGGRPVLRMILPDRAGCFDTLPYKLQFEKRGLEPNLPPTDPTPAP